jgi:hypothetical protein
VEGVGENIKSKYRAGVNTTTHVSSCKQTIVIFENITIFTAHLNLYYNQIKTGLTQQQCCFLNILLQNTPKSKSIKNKVIIFQCLLLQRRAHLHQRNMSKTVPASTQL